MLIPPENPAVLSPAAQAIFDEWSPSIWITLSTLLTAAIYINGWRRIRRTRPQIFPPLRLASFLTGLAVLWIAIDSPLDGFADILLSAHMVEHLLLMSVVPPLLLLGRPVVPMLRGLPRWILKPVLGPLLRTPPLRRLSHWLVSPLVAWLAMNLTFLGWHVPAAYDFALEHEGWHAVEHLCFLLTSILFWWPILNPWPSRARGQRWLIILFVVIDLRLRTCN